MEKNLTLRDECNVLRSREDEMRTLVTVQMNLLSPEKAKSDLDGIVRVKAKVTPVQVAMKNIDLVVEEDEKNCEEEEED